MTPARDSIGAVPGLRSGDAFRTAEWELAADWDVPEEWHRFVAAPADLQGVGAGAAVPPARRPYPRRRDLRSSLVDYEMVDPALELAVEEALVPALDPSVLADLYPEAPARTPVVYPRRRDVHRRAARHGGLDVGPRPVLAPTTERPGRRRVAVRAGVVVALLAASSAAVAGSQGLGPAMLTFGEGRDVSAAEAAGALALAPVPQAAPVTLWDVMADTSGPRKQSAPMLDRRAAVAAQAAATEALAVAGDITARARAEKVAAERRKAAEAAAEAAAKARREARARAERSAQRDPKGIARIMVSERGWDSGQWRCLDLLWERESNWRWNADNPTSSAYGIPQSLPGSKMSSAGSDWRTNPVTQIEWGLGYIEDRYGTPCAAWGHSEDVGWY